MFYGNISLYQRTLKKKRKTKLSILKKPPFFCEMMTKNGRLTPKTVTLKENK
ncbi:hypothetical protein HMPREF1239_0731 [Streptococcus pyogenes GA03805]|nr:hypothetical protein HMPREF1239_0731 [Streptococcus pyogenes GA03805]